MSRQRPTAGLAGLTAVESGAGASVAGCGGSHRRRSAAPGDERGCTVSCERRRLPHDALIKLEVELRLFEEVPVRHRLASIGPGGRSARGRDPGRAGRLTDVGENQLDGRGIGDARR